LSHSRRTRHSAASRIGRGIDGKKLIVQEWNSPLFPAGEQLWGAVTSGVALSHSETIVRYRYAEMDLLQPAAPADAGMSGRASGSPQL
jgi:hypothetical protein